MIRLALLVLSALCIFSITGATPARAIARSKYTKPHSLGDSYTFDPRDGWQSFNASNPQYKHRREPAKKDAPEKKPAVSNLLSIPQAIKAAFNGLRGEGPSESTIITWYTGHDLLNPSCWANTPWAPTDSSFVCALTLDGWQNKPECLSFLQMCNGPEKCVFVRVVDSCAGCAPGSRHVDMTKDSFSQLAPLETGTATVMARPATPPTDIWFEDLWGPEEK
ncbi:Non-catalytic module family EXPN protein [Mycena maculata]|uniref:Non-catalytic module family EXPN protein n=1 Tax=Mycena maculata TaxID=230809 RepID=A0AAD7IJF5_9AGAR|nr:Non-catalytic module family EXPN protein [Mycena maculata]